MDIKFNLGHMWTSTDFSTYNKDFDFTSSSLGVRSYTALKIGNIEFINMIEKIDWECGEDQIFQSLICDQCGHPHCASGNWIALRRLETFIFFIPAFEYMLSEPDWGEYEPPHYLKKNGSLWMKERDFKRLVQIVPAFEQLRTIKNLSVQEMELLFKWESPQNIFGTLPELKEFKTERILATSHLNNDRISNLIEEKLEELGAVDNYRIEPIVQDEFVNLYLDDSANTEWTALCISSAGFSLTLGKHFKIIVSN